MTEGTLGITGKKKNKKLQLRFINAKGDFVQKMLATIPPEQISISLTEKIEEDINQLRDIEVEFEEEEGGLIKKIREKGKDWDREERKLIVRTEAQVEGDFHNPYNFIPTPPRKTDYPDLGDHKPAGHGIYHTNHWSGRISISLVTKTPLLIPDAAKLEETEDKEKHKTYPIRLEVDGKPYLPPTSLKGMLRSAYEAVTNSRLSIFEKHDDRLAYRMPAEKIAVVPARVERGGEKLYLRIMDEPGLVGGVAKLKRYQNGNSLPQDKGESRVATRYDKSNVIPQHKDCVWVKLTKGKVTKIVPFQAAGQPDADWKKGWVCVTGPNINGKKNERVFIESDDNQLIPVNADIIALWEELIQNYQKTHKKELEKRKQEHNSPKAYLGKDPGKTGWSRHIHTPSDVKLDEGTLCYVEFTDNKVTGIQPVIISRRLYKLAPEKLLDCSLQPAQKMDELSPADRVFGWVNQKGKGSYKGNLRISGVNCISDNPLEEFGNQGLPLAILGEPKPQQARFYQAKDKDGTPLDSGNKVKKEAGYSNVNQGLRGRKVYPHHRPLPDGHWDNPLEDRTQEANKGHYQEYRRPQLNGWEQRDDQNRSLKAWVKPEVKFSFNIDVTNLSSVELGALLWLLSLPDDCYHRLGGGKPLGFGSVHLKINWDKSDLRQGKAWQEFYSSLLPEEIQSLDSKLPAGCIEEFKKAVERAYGQENGFEQVSFIAAFCRCAKGFEDNLPIHYPRIEPEPKAEGEAFQWFVDNERTGDDGGKKLSLSSLVNDPGLPLNRRT